MNPTVVDNVREAVRTIWEVTLGLEVAPAVEAVEGPSSELWTGSIRIYGGWEGAVILECPPDLAQEVASRMFGIAPAEATAADVQDALGELTNILGGNVKALLPGPSLLSLPEVTEGHADAPEPSQRDIVARIEFLCRDADFRVTVRHDSPA